MQSIDVTRNTHSIVFSRAGSFLTSVPLRHLTRPGEIVDVLRRLALAVNSDRPGSLLKKIHDEMTAPYTPSAIVTKSRETRLENFRQRTKRGPGYATKNNKKTRRKVRAVKVVVRPVNRHWPADEESLYVDLVRDGLVGHGATRAGSSRWRRVSETLARAKSVFHFDVP